MSDRVRPTTIDMSVAAATHWPINMTVVVVSAEKKLVSSSLGMQVVIAIDVGIRLQLVTSLCRPLSKRANCSSTARTSSWTAGSPRSRCHARLFWRYVCVLWHHARLFWRYVCVIWCHVHLCQEAHADRDFARFGELVMRSSVAWCGGMLAPTLMSVNAWPQRQQPIPRHVLGHLPAHLLPQRRVALHHTGQSRSILNRELSAHHSPTGGARFERAHGRGGRRLHLRRRQQRLRLLGAPPHPDGQRGARALFPGQGLPPAQKEGPGGQGRRRRHPRGGREHGRARGQVSAEADGRGHGGAVLPRQGGGRAQGVQRRQPQPAGHDHLAAEMRSMPLVCTQLCLKMTNPREHMHGDDQTT